jgi:3-dehydroquinate dehydratase I
MICIPIKAKNLEELKKQIKKIPKKMLVEIWIDQLPSYIPAREILAVGNHKKIIVNKPKSEHGAWEDGEKERIARLLEFIEENADYIDIGIDTKEEFVKKIIKAAGKKVTKIIVSFHDFKKTPSQSKLKEIVLKAKKTGADIVKIVTFAKKKADNLRVISLYEEEIPIIAFTMGQLGKISRINALFFGPFINYIALDAAKKTAPGQLTLKEYQLIKKIIKI